MQWSESLTVCSIGCVAVGGVDDNNDAYRRQTVEAQSLSTVFVGARQAPEQFSDVVMPELDGRLGGRAQATLDRGRRPVGQQQPHHFVVAPARRCREREIIPLTAAGRPRVSCVVWAAYRSGGRCRRGRCARRCRPPGAGRGARARPQRCPAGTSDAPPSADDAPQQQRNTISSSSHDTSAQQQILYLAAGRSGHVGIDARFEQDLQQQSARRRLLLLKGNAPHQCEWTFITHARTRTRVAAKWVSGGSAYGFAVLGERGSGGWRERDGFDDVVVAPVHARALALRQVPRANGLGAKEREVSRRARSKDAEGRCGRGCGGRGFTWS